MTRIQIRRDTAANWTSANPTLAQGEIGYEVDTRKQKIGDGTTAWTALAYQPIGTLTSVAGKTGTNGAVTLVKGDVGLASVDNVADASKPVSTAQAAAIASAQPGSITQNSNGTWPSRASVSANRTTAKVTWTGTLPGPAISTQVTDAVAGLDALYATATIP